MTPFEHVRAIVRKIPRGRVATYGQISQLIERRLTPVGVGWALAKCDDSIPWHRVINARGGISTDGEHPGLQRALLESEGVRFGRDGLVDLEKVQWEPRPSRAKKLTRPRPRRRSNRAKSPRAR